MKPFPDKKYNIIYADPPWEYKESGSGSRVVSSHYATMAIDDIRALPVRDICKDNAILFLWSTFPRLEQSISVFHHWGFKYYGLGFSWIKTNKDGTPFIGLGYYTRQNSEVCLIGTKKERIGPLSRKVSSVVISKREKHSKKPDIVRNKIVEICGDLPRIELFARQKTPGWDVWGDEI